MTVTTGAQTQSEWDATRIDELRQAFQGIGTAQIHDAARDKVRVLDLGLVLRSPALKLAGPAYPVETDDDILPGLQALEVAPPGSVVFIHDRAKRGDAIAGDIVVTTVKEQGLGGLVVNGSMRDIEFIQDIGVPVFSRHVTPVSAKTEVPAAALPCSVTLADGIELHPGDWLFGDVDGMVLVPQDVVRAVVASALMIYRREEEVKTALRSGERLSALTGLQDFVSDGTPMRFRP